MSASTSVIIRWILALPIAACLAVLLFSSDFNSKILATVFLVLLAQAREISLAGEICSSFEETRRQERAAAAEAQAQAVSLPSVVSSGPLPAPVPSVQKMVMEAKPSRPHPSA